MNSTKNNSSTRNATGKSSEEVWLSGELARDAKSELAAKTPALAVSGAVLLLAVLGFLVFGFLWPRRRRRRRQREDGGGGGAGAGAGAGPAAGRAVERGDIEAGPYAWPKSERVYFIPDAAAADDARFFARQGRPSKKKPPLAEGDLAPVHGRATRPRPRAAEMGGAGDAACNGRKAEGDEREQAARYGKTSDTGAVGRETIYFQINYEHRSVKCTKMSKSAGDGRDGETLITNEEILRTPLVQKTTVKKVRFDLSEEPRKSTRLCQGLATKWCFSTEDEGRSFEVKDIRNKKTDSTARTPPASASQKDSVLNEKMNKTIHANKDVGSVSEAHEIVGNSPCKFPDYIFVKKSTSELSVKNSPVTCRKEIGAVNCVVRQKNIVKLQKNLSSEIPKTAKKILRNRDESCLMKDAEEFNALFVALLQMRLSGAKRGVLANGMRCVEGLTDGVGSEKSNPERQMVPYVRNEIRDTLISLYQRCAPKKSEARRDTVRKLNSQAQKSNKNKSLKKREMSVQVVAEERVGKAMIDTVGLSFKNLRDGQKISDLASQLDPKHFELIVLGLDIFQLTLGMFCRLFFVGATVEEVDAYTEIREKVEKRILTLLELSEDKMIEDTPDRKNNLTKEQIIFVLYVHLAFIEHDLSSYKFLLGGIIGCLEYSFVYSVSLFEKEELAQKRREAEAKAAAVREAGVARAARRLAVRGGRGAAGPGGRPPPALPPPPPPPPRPHTRARQDDAPSPLRALALVPAPAPAPAPAAAADDDAPPPSGGSRTHR